jgi:cell division protein FtsQ
LAGAGAYAIARETSAFAIRELAVEGAPSTVAADVRRALEPSLGESLVVLDVERVDDALERLPVVAAAEVDRAFPHTLRVSIRPEVPAAVLRQGERSWLAGASGRVIAELPRSGRPPLPRVWLRRGEDVRVGDRVAGKPLAAVRAVAPLRAQPLPARVAFVRASAAELTLVLRSGLEVRLGDGGDRDVKLEVARRILPALPADARYLDVSVPQRAVADGTLDSQVEVEGQASTPP